MTNTPQQAVTAAMLAIGDELLSGRTKDKNIGHLADVLTAAGIDLKEVRIVPDDEDAIVSALNALRPGFDYVLRQAVLVPPTTILRQMRCRALLKCLVSMMKRQ